MEFTVIKEITLKLSAEEVQVIADTMKKASFIPSQSIKAEEIINVLEEVLEK